jgi:hypothetical protein
MVFVIFIVCVLYLLCLINVDSQSAAMISINLYLFLNNLHLHLLQTEIYYYDFVKNAPYYTDNNVCNSSKKKTPVL